MEKTWNVSTLLLSKRHKKHIPLRGVIHVGGAMCEEWEDYRDLNAGKVLWLEGNPTSVEKGRAVLAMNRVDHNQKVVQAFLSHANGSESFYVTAKNSHNDSLMKPCDWYDEVALKEVKTVAVKRLDTLIPDIGENIGDYNTLVVDVQGAELKVIAGCGDILNNMDFVVCEAWYDELYVFGNFIYEGGTPVGKLKDLLQIFGFEETERIPPEEEDPTHTHGWVDVLFERKS